jgi:hypothetical protein
MNNKKSLDALGLVLVPVGVAILFVGIGHTSRGEEIFGVSLIAAGLVALFFAWRMLGGRAPTHD